MGVVVVDVAALARFGLGSLRGGLVSRGGVGRGGVNKRNKKRLSCPALSGGVLWAGRSDGR